MRGIEWFIYMKGLFLKNMSESERDKEVYNYEGTFLEKMSRKYHKFCYSYLGG